MRRLLAAAILLLAWGCGADEQPAVPRPPATARSLLLITIDTLRADRVGAYGDTSAKTPAMDALAARGALFTRAFAAAPITLPSHATLLTGRYPPGHGARHNGMRVDAAVPTIAAALLEKGFATGAFVAAFPLDRRFGLSRGFQAYGDRMPRGTDGRAVNERAGSLVVDEAAGWLDKHRGDRFFLWVHLFEPHAPYRDARDGRPAPARYGDEVAEADRQIARLIDALGAARESTLVAVASDHGEAFGEHEEIAHSVFVYDTTLRVPLILAGPGVAHRTIEAPVGLVDVAATVMPLLGAGSFDSDGIDLSPAMAGSTVADRVLYAESFAPLLDFGWSPLRAVRAGGWKYIAAPQAELYQVTADVDESQNVVSADRPRAAAMQAQVDKYSPDHLTVARKTDPETAARLQALGYVSGSAIGRSRPDPKARRATAARIAQVTSGELHGEALERLLRQILADEPRNPLANVRLGYLLLESGRCAEAMPNLRAAIAARYPSADPHLGLAGCQAAQRDFKAAAATLRAADAVEPGNPVVLANFGLMLSDAGTPQAAIEPLLGALSIDPDLHQARFGLAIAFARTGQRPEAAAQAEELLRRLPAGAPQRPEVERLLAAVR